MGTAWLAQQPQDCPVPLTQPPGQSLFPKSLHIPAGLPRKKEVLLQGRPSSKEAPPAHPRFPGIAPTTVCPVPGAGSALHDGAGEATALLEQGQACLGHVGSGGLLSPRCHLLLPDRSCGQRNPGLPGDRAQPGAGAQSSSGAAADPLRSTAPAP